MLDFGTGKTCWDFLTHLEAFWKFKIFHNLLSHNMLIYYGREDPLLWNLFFMDLSVFSDPGRFSKWKNCSIDNYSLLKYLFLLFFSFSPNSILTIEIVFYRLGQNVPRDIPCILLYEN